MTFNEWLKKEYGQNWQGLHMDLVEEGFSEEEINNKHNEMIDAFQEYMELHEIEIVLE